MRVLPNDSSRQRPCKGCGGDGEGQDWCDGSLVVCPDCNGSGLARMVALDDVVEALRDVQAGINILGDNESWDALRNGMADFIERRFSGTGAQPQP